MKQETITGIRADLDKLKSAIPAGIYEKLMTETNARIDRVAKQKEIEKRTAAVYSLLGDVNNVRDRAAFLARLVILDSLTAD